MLKHLCVQFDIPLKQREVPLFRGAVVAKVGREHDLFHNHIDANQYMHRYPLIQYKVLGGRASIVCLGEGTAEIHQLFEKQDWSLQIGEREEKMAIYSLELKQFELAWHEKMLAYRIHDWIGLNQANYAIYQTLPTEAEKTEFLEKRLIGHILGFAGAMDWHIDAPVQVRLLDDMRIQPVRLKDQKLMGFSATFLTNVFLPYHIGLGGKSALGFGTVKKASNSKGEF